MRFKFCGERKYHRPILPRTATHGFQSCEARRKLLFGSASVKNPGQPPGRPDRPAQRTLGQGPGRTVPSPAPISSQLASGFRVDSGEKSGGPLAVPGGRTQPATRERPPAGGQTGGLDSQGQALSRPQARQFQIGSWTESAFVLATVPRRSPYTSAS